jgi:hypothetical protein
MRTRPAPSFSHIPTNPALCCGVRGTNRRSDSCGSISVECTNVCVNTIPKSPLRRRASSSVPIVRVGSSALTISIKLLGAGCNITASRIMEPKRLPFNSMFEWVHPRSTDPLQARSASRFLNGSNLDRPTASVSSVKGVGANTPVPVESRTVHWVGRRTNTDTRGLKNVRHSLWKSARALPDSVNRGPKADSS